MLMDTSFAGHLMAFQDSYVTHLGLERLYTAEVRRPVARTTRLLRMAQEIVVAFRSSCNCRAVWWQPAEWCEIIKIKLTADRAERRALSKSKS